MQSKLIDFASDKISKKLKNIKAEDIEKVVNSISKTYQSLKMNADKKKVAEEPTHNSMESVFFECDTAPPKPSRLLSQVPAQKPKFMVPDSDSLKMEKDSLLANSRETLNAWPKKGLTMSPFDGKVGNTTSISSYQDVADKTDHIEGTPNAADPSRKPPNAHNDFSNFVQKKSIAQGMMDLALVSANTNQLRYVIDMNHNHPYYATSLTLIISSLILQVGVGLALLYSNRFNIRKQNEMKLADRINNLSIIGVFMITLINVFISTFNGSGVHPPPSTPGPSVNATDCPVCPTPFVDEVVPIE